MARNKKPSIYSDRSGIGSAEELDEYGVWIKSEPQVLSADNSDVNKSDDVSFDLVDPVLNIEETADNNNSITFDDVDSDVKEEVTGENATDDEIITLDDVDFDVKEEAPEVSLTDDKSLSLDDVDFDIKEETAGETAGLDDIEFSEGNIESDITNEPAPAEALGIIDSNTDASIDMEAANFDDFEISSDFGDEDGEKEKPVENDIDDNFDIPTVKSIENNISNVQENLETAAGIKEGDLSTQLLLKIANELSSIRGELSDLKKEFSMIRNVAPEEKHGFFTEEDDETIALTGDELDNIISTSEEGPKEETVEEDEVIALTGDELDNILNSADFTEESGTNETPESEFSLDDENSDIPAENPEEEQSPTDDLDGDSLSIDDTDTTLELNNDAAEVDNVTEPDTDDMSSIVFEDDIPSGETAVFEETTENIDDELPDIDTDGLDLDVDTDKLPEEETPIEEETSIEEESEKAEDDYSGSEILNIKTDDDLDLNMDVDLSDDIFDDFSDADKDSAGIDDIEIKDSEELKKLREEGATHVTFAPENSSYLEEESADLASDSIDLSGAVIDEPDLSTDGISDNLEEPSLSETELDLDSLEDITIDNAEISFEEKEQESAEPQGLEPFEDLDIDIPQDDLFAEETTTPDEVEPVDIDTTAELEEPVKQEPESLETEIEDEPVSFNDDFTNDDFGDMFDTEIVDAEFQAEEKKATAVQASQPPEEVTASKASPAASGVEPAVQAAQAAKEVSSPQAETGIIPQAGQARGGKSGFELPSELKTELKNILSYMDQLLESLPEQKIEEFAKSQYFDSYKKLFKDLGLV
jgi:hypothetical protein